MQLPEYHCEEDDNKETTNLTDLDVRDLELMFQDPTATLTVMQKDWWNGWIAGREIDQNVYRALPTYKVAADLFAEFTGKSGASKSREAYLAKLRAEQAFYKACAAEHVGRYRSSQQTVDAAVLLVIDAEGNVLPRVALLDAGVPADEVARITSKTGARRKVKKSLQKHALHPNAQRMIQTTGKREYMRMAADTLSGSLEGIAVNMKTQARLARLEAATTALAAEVAELRAFRIATEARLEVVEAGEHWHDVARRMLADGSGPTAIANATGQLVNTVKQFVKRNR